jgi:hypothetical protein
VGQPATPEDKLKPILTSPPVPEADVKPVRDKKRNKIGTDHFGILIFNESMNY